MNRSDSRATVLVYVQSYEDSVPRGVFLTLPEQEKYAFCGLDQLLLILEDLLDGAGAPEEAFGHRYLYEDQAPYVFLEPAGGWTGPKTKGLPGGKASCSIQIGYRQHRSMQGRLSYQTDDAYETVSFRSALELMRMLHEYLSRKMVPAAKEAGV